MMSETNTAVASIISVEIIELVTSLLHDQKLQIERAINKSFFFKLEESWSLVIQPQTT